MSAAHFAGRLRELREAAGISQAELGRRAGIAQNSIARLERAERHPSWETVIVLADALGVTVDAFREEPGEQEPREAGRPPKHPEPEPPRRHRRTKKD